MMDDRKIERVTHALKALDTDPDVWGSPIYDVNYVAIAKAAVVAMTTPPAGVVKLPVSPFGKAILDGYFSPAELRNIADWFEKSGSPSS